MGSADTVGTPGADEMYCPECGSIIRTKAEICPDCGVRVADEGDDDDKSRIGYRGYLGMGVGGGIVALIFLPPVFGLLSLFGGIQLYRRHNELQGIVVIIWSVVATLIGLVIGFLSLFAL
jgi:hypothetical protein